MRTPFSLHVTSRTAHVGAAFDYHPEITNAVRLLLSHMCSLSSSNNAYGYMLDCRYHWSITSEYCGPSEPLAGAR